MIYLLCSYTLAYNKNNNCYYYYYNADDTGRVHNNVLSMTNTRGLDERVHKRIL